MIPKKKCRDSDLPRWVERLRGQIKEREGAKEGSREDTNVGIGEGEGELSSFTGEEIVDEIPGGDGGHSQEDEERLADADSTSDTLAYEGGIGQTYVLKKRQKRKRKVPKWLINMSVIVKSKRNIVNCMMGDGHIKIYICLRS